VTLICDFCSSTPVAVEYPARDIEMDPGHPGSPSPLDKQFVSVGSWYACAPCARFIQAEWWDALAQRQVEQYLDRHPEERADTVWLQAWVRIAQAKFREARSGEPRPVGR
jgi:hypothetical protein